VNRSITSIASTGDRKLHNDRDAWLTAIRHLSGSSRARSHALVNAAGLVGTAQFGKGIGQHHR